MAGGTKWRGLPLRPVIAIGFASLTTVAALAENIVGTIDDDDIFAPATADTISGGFGSDLIYGDPSFGNGQIQALEAVSLDANGDFGSAGATRGVLFEFENLLVFESASPDLVAGDTNGASDIFLKSLDDGAIIRMTTGMSAAEPNGDSSAPAFSADGEAVVFTSIADNLVTADINGESDVFFQDIDTDDIFIASVNDNGDVGDDASSEGVMNAYGMIAFTSAATNLVTGDSNATRDIFLRDAISSLTTRISTDENGAQADGASFGPVFSPDGFKVAFTSAATNLVPGDTNGATDIFIKDLTTDTIERVSLTDANTEADGRSNGVRFSPDGKKIVFYSEATNIVADDTNATTDVFVRTLATGETVAVSRDLNGDFGNGSSEGQAIFSNDGRKVAFVTAATNLAAGDTNGTVTDVLVRDLDTGAISAISTYLDGTTLAQGANGSLSFSHDGTQLLFATDTGDADPNDTNGHTDLYLATLAPPSGGDDVIDGGPAQDLIFGGPGNDTLIPGTEDDYVDGEDDIDTLVLPGPRSRYLISAPGCGCTYVVDLDTASNYEQGVDLVVNTERFKFGDQPAVQAGDVGPNNRDPLAADIEFEVEAGDTLTGRLGLSDPDGNPLDVTVARAPAAGRFTLDRDGLGFTFVASRKIGSVEASLEIEDPYLGFADQTVTINVVEPGSLTNRHRVSKPRDIDSKPNRIAEDAPAGSRVGITARAVDRDTTDNKVSYEIVSGPSFLAIDSKSGIVRLARALPEGAGGTRSFVVRARSSDGSAARKRFTIVIEKEPAEENIIRGTPRDDRLVGTPGPDLILGLAGNDKLFGRAGVDELRAGSGDDLLDGGAGPDHMLGGPGDDIYISDHERDRITERPDAGTDEVRAIVSRRLGPNVDNLVLGGRAAIDGIGNRDANILIGNDARNQLIGLGGDDTLEGRGGADVLVGGPGRDTATYQAARRGVIVSLSAGRAREADGIGDRLIGIENLTGSAFADRLTGNAIANVLTGLAGADMLTGDKGADRFVYLSVDDSPADAPDTITDFDMAAGDLIDLAAIDADPSTPADDALVYIGGAAFSGNPGELRLVGTERARKINKGQFEVDLDGDKVADLVVKLVWSDTIGEAAIIK